MEYQDQSKVTLVETYIDLTEMGGFHFDEMQCKREFVEVERPAPQKHTLPTRAQLN